MKRALETFDSDLLRLMTIALDVTVAATDTAQADASELRLAAARFILADARCGERDSKRLELAALQHIQMLFGGAAAAPTQRLPLAHRSSA